MKIGESITAFVSSCQEMYDNEIAEVSYSTLISFTDITLNHKLLTHICIFFININIFLFQELTLRKGIMKTLKGEKDKSSEKRKK